MATPAEEKGWRWWLQHLLVPVVLTIVTVVGAVVATNIQGRHDRQKELEFKSDLLGRMSSSATRAVFQSQAVADRTAIRRVLNDPVEAPLAYQEAYDNNIREWRLASAEIDTSVTAYFGKGTSSCWARYSGLLVDYLLLAADPSPRRTMAFNALASFSPPKKCPLTASAITGALSALASFSPPKKPKKCPLTAMAKSPTDREVLRAGLDTTDQKFSDIPKCVSQAFREAYGKLGDAMLRTGDPLIASLVTRHARGF